MSLFTKFSREMLYCCMVIGCAVFMIQKVVISSHVEQKEYWDNNLELMIDHYINKPKSSLDLEAQKYDIVAQVIKEMAPKTILEVGCGFGYTLKQIVQRYPAASFWGCDWSQSLVEGAKKYLKNIVPEGHLMVADAIGLGERFTNPFDVIVTHGCLVCMKSDRVTKALNEFARFANNIVLVEADYSKFSHENVKNGYPVNDYEAILKECGWHMVGRNDTFMNVSGISNVSIIWAVKNSLQNGDVQCSTEING